VLRELRTLIERDAEAVADGLYPLSALVPETSPVEHTLRYLRLLADSIEVAARKRDRRPREFGARAASFLSEVPSYYRRNFHFQTDGYLSERSAELYEHQVEILFRGVGDAMRRAVIPPLARHLHRTGGRRRRLLELGAGCGTATRFVAQALPDARITCVDLSPPYLKKARERLSDRDRIDFLQGDAAELDLRDDRFDAVYSVFLFHELPLAERRRVLSEARRVLRPGGVHVVVDALQRGDVPDLDWALEAFPREFHEPYFRSYTRQPLETLLREAGFSKPRTSTAFLSKVVVATC
jgi:ubiquinone/menaquinone biosynthesis C-methylase UbiE